MACRRIAVNRLIIGDKTLCQYVIEVGDGGVVDRYYPLSGELPFTEWRGGAIELVEAPDGSLVVKGQETF